MSEAVYVLCGVTSIVCAWLLLKHYRASRIALLFWAALCFVGLALDNVLLFVDIVLLPNVDLFLWRTLPALAGVLILLYGLIWDSR
jgi:hypothetical protein